MTLRRPGMLGAAVPVTPLVRPGRHETSADDTIRARRPGEDFTVGEENTAVLCGTMTTPDATVSRVDAVLRP